MKYIFLSLVLIFFSFQIQALEKEDFLPSEGEYNRDISLKVINQEPDSEIFFYFENSISKKPVLYNESLNPLILSSFDGQEKKYRITFIDKTKDNSSITLEYIINKKNIFETSEKTNNTKNKVNIKNKVKQLNILSPETGNYYNKQLLFINKIGFEWIKYSFENKKSALNGKEYLKPVTIEKTGNISLFTAAKPYNSDTVLYKKINFNVSLSDNIKTDLKKIKNNFFLTAFSSRIIMYSFSGSNNFSRYKEPVQLFSDINSSSYNTVFLKNYNDKTSYKYRYFINFDNRKLKEPLINISYQDNNLTVTIDSDEYADTYYTINNKTADRKSNYYEKPITISTVKNSNNITINIKAVSFRNDNKSSISEKIFTYKTKKPPKPELIKINNLEHGKKQLYIKNINSTKLLYTISENSPPDNPDKYSPGISSTPILKNPYGRDSFCYIKISAADSFGNISEPLELKNLLVDHYPPEPPKVALNNNYLMFDGNNKIYYSLGYSFSNKSGDWNVYENPVNLNTLPGTYNGVFVSYYSKDNAGNKSRTFNKEYSIDNKTPSVYLPAIYQSGSSLNSDIIIKKSMFDPSFDIYFTISNNSTIPMDPDTGSEKLDKDLILTCLSGTEIFFTLKLLPVSKINKNRGQIKTYYFHLDKKPPTEPILNRIQDSYYSGRALIEVDKGVKDNILYYSYSFDSIKTKSPFEGLSTTENLIIIPLDEKIRKICNVKIGVEDQAGNRTESDNIFNFYIDNRDYKKIKFTELSKNSMSRDDIIIKKPSDDFIYRFEISNRSDTLKNVDFMSDILAENLIFSADDGKEKKYYLALKSFLDENDRIGSEQEIFGILTDRKKPDPPIIKITDGNMITLDGENNIFYSISTEKSKNKDYRPYSYPFLLNSYIPPGRYNIKAYSRDRAGNTSELRTDSFYISKNILYVSDKYGNNKNSGTKHTSPLKTLKYAFSEYLNNKIDTIIVLDGEFSLTAPLLVTKPLMITGTKGESIFYDKLPESDNIFTVSDSSLIIKGISLISDNFRKNCFDSENSVIVFDNSNFILNCSNFINQRNSRTIIEDSSLTLKSRLNSTAFNNYLSTLKIDASSIDMYSDSDITGIKLLKSPCYLTDSSFTFKSSRSVNSFNLKNSILNMKNIRVKNISKELSNTIISDRSKINITNSFISDAKGSTETLHFSLNKSKLHVKGSNITLNSKKKSSLIKSMGSENRFSDSLLISGTPNNTSSLISSEDDLFYLFNCDLSLRNSMNGGIITSEDSIFEINTTMFKNNSTENKTFIDIKGKSSFILIDNIFKGRGDIFQSSKQSSVLNKNSIQIEE